MRIATMSPRLPRPLLLCGLVLVGSATAAHAFDVAGYRSRLDTTLAEVKGGSIVDPKATLARLDEMVALGKQAAAEYAAKQPKYAKLMDVAVTDTVAMRGMTDGELEDKWGENGTAGDAVNVPLKSLGQFDQTRAYLELMVAPSHAEIFVQKWQTKHKSALLEKASDELTELDEHLKQVQ